MGFAAEYFSEVVDIVGQLDIDAVDSMAERLAEIRERGGRLFILGVGGSAANASHAVNDFRKLCGMEAYAPTDNVSELTARTNDEGWDTIFAEWLKTSRLGAKDAILVFSVGGGNAELNVSANLVYGIDAARECGAAILAIVGRDGGHAGKAADIAIVVPTVAPSRVTPHAEAFQAVIWHCLVSHPKLQTAATKW